MNSTFTMSQGAGQKLEFAFQRNDGTTSDLDWLSTGDNLKSIILLARGEAELVHKTKPAPEPQQVIDPIIRVDRSIRPPSYPDWVEKVMHPELENVGPAEYDIAKTEQWLHDGQQNGKWIEGDKIYAHLNETGDLKNHFTLRDLEEIRKKGLAFFRKYFNGKAVFGWGSVVRSRNSRLCVPCLYGDGDEVVLDWDWLGGDWGSNRPGLRRAS